MNVFNQKSNLNPKKIIDELNLIPHPEGGHYREVYRSDATVSSRQANDIRSGVTDIYFMLAKGEVSRFHKVLHDEIWHFYMGAPLKLIEIEKGKLSEVTLGDYENRIRCKHTVKGGLWQAAESLGEFSLVGCTVAPGFDFRDFSFLRDFKEEAGDIEKRFPQYHKFI